MALPLSSIRQHFSGLKDPRRSHRRLHNLLDIIAIALCAVIANANSWQDIATFADTHEDWLRRSLRLPNGIPSHDTFERVFSRLDPMALQECLLAWLKDASGLLRLEHIAIDGKTARRSGSKTRGLGPLQIVSAWAVGQQAALGQVLVAEGSNEIPAIPALLGMLDLHGALVTIDAIGTQKEVARAIVEGGGDYVLAVKDNQDHLHADIEACFTAAMEDGFEGVRHDEHKSEEDGHGRHEVRHCIVIYDPPAQAIRNKKEWQGLKVIGLRYSERTVDGKTSRELRHFIGSRKMTAKEYAQVIRGHWEVENCLHWRLDVVFREDDSRIQQRNAQANFAWLRKMALNLLKQHPGKESIGRKRLRAAYDTKFLEQVMRPSTKVGKP